MQSFRCCRINGVARQDEPVRKLIVAGVLLSLIPALGGCSTPDRSR